MTADLSDDELAARLAEKGLKPETVEVLVRRRDHSDVAEAIAQVLEGQEPLHPSKWLDR